LNEAYDATVTYSDDQIAILSPRDGLTPLDHVVLQANEPRLNSPVSIAGFSFGGVLARPTLTFGELADVQGLAGENVNRLTLAANDGDIGGPVFDAGGAVIGVLLPAVAKSGQVLPSDVAVAAKLDRITTALAQTGANTTVTDQFASMPAATLTTLAADVTVLVSCW
jgi:S1-C subfamily serine protease